MTAVDFSVSFSFPQGHTVTLRAVKEGYVTGSQTLDGGYVSSPGGASPVINLAPNMAPVVIEPGAYQLTVENPCGFIPEELRTQTFPATITPAALQGATPGTRYSVVVNDAGFSPYYSKLVIGVAGNDVAIAEEEWLYWQVSPFRYFEGSTDAVTVSVIASSVPTLSFPFGATYCELNSPMMGAKNCFTTPAAQKVTYGVCSGGMTLTRQ